MTKAQSRIEKNINSFTEPGPSVQGPPTKAIILAPVPGLQAASSPVATLNATPVHRAGRFPGETGHWSVCNSSNT